MYKLDCYVYNDIVASYYIKDFNKTKASTMFGDCITFEDKIKGKMSYIGNDEIGYHLCKGEGPSFVTNFKYAEVKESKEIEPITFRYVERKNVKNNCCDYKTYYSNSCSLGCGSWSERVVSFCGVYNDPCGYVYKLVNTCSSPSYFGCGGGGC